MTKESFVTHRGGCHCGAVRWEFEAAPDLIATDCNCTPQFKLQFQRKGLCSNTGEHGVGCRLGVHNEAE